MCSGRATGLAGPSALLVRLGLPIFPFLPPMHKTHPPGKHKAIARGVGRAVQFEGGGQSTQNAIGRVLASLASCTYTLQTPIKRTHCEVECRGISLLTCACAVHSFARARPHPNPASTPPHAAPCTIYMLHALAHRLGTFLCPSFPVESHSSSDTRQQTNTRQ